MTTEITNELTYEELEARLADWAAGQAHVRAVIAVGSRARGTPDRWSDLDILLLTSDRDRLAGDPEWLHGLGDVWLTYLDATGPGDPEWYALYDGGLKMDIVLLHVDDPSLDLDTLLSQHPYNGVLARGAVVLYDSAGEPRTMEPREPELAPPPTADEFASIVKGFLLESVTAAKFIGRGDYWRAQRWFAYELRPRLLKMAEWQAHGKDTWYNGRFMAQWADPRAVTVLTQSFTPAERAAMIRTMRLMLTLFKNLGEEVAERHSLDYPGEVHEKVVALIGTVFVAKPDV
jgi:aminoglycoside 6-adenylyltransferase